MTKSFFGQLGLTLSAIALVGAGCATGTPTTNNDGPAKDAVIVTTPKPNETVTIPLHVAGTGATPGENVYASIYENGELKVESEVPAADDGSYNFTQIWIIGEYGPKLELRVGEKDAVGKLMKATTMPLTVNQDE